MNMQTGLQIKLNHAMTPMLLAVFVDARIIFRSFIARQVDNNMDDHVVHVYVLKIGFLNACMHTRMCGCLVLDGLHFFLFDRVGLGFTPPP
jgi:hypothetical protein